MNAATFLAIISLLAAGFAFWTKQPKTGLGFIILAGAFILLMENLAVGVRANFYQAFGMVLFVAGAAVICGKKLTVKEEKKEEKENQ